MIAALIGSPLEFLGGRWRDARPARQCVVTIRALVQKPNLGFWIALASAGLPSAWRPIKPHMSSVGHRDGQERRGRFKARRLTHGADVTSVVVLSPARRTTLIWLM